MSTIQRDEFHAALGRLESLAKGQGQTQLFATPSDSNPGTWAGTSQTDVDEFSDGIDDNGTDYSGVKKALAAKVAKSQALTPAEVAIVKGQDPRQMIAQKVYKGERLTPAESWAIKGGAKFFAKSKKGDIIIEDKKDKKDMPDDDGDDENPFVKKASTSPNKAPSSGNEGDAKKVPDTNAGGDTDDEIEDDAKKSLEGAINQTQQLRKGIEMSPILAEFARAMGEGLRGVEARTAQRLQKSIIDALTPLAEYVGQMGQAVAKHIDEQGNFNKGFAEAVVGIGQQIAGSSEMAMASAMAPVGAPKSQMRGAPAGVQPIQKSFGPGGLDMSDNALAKSQVTDAMFELVKGGKLSSLDVVKFDSTGELTPQVKSMVLAHVQGNR